MCAGGALAAVLLAGTGAPAEPDTPPEAPDAPVALERLLEIPSGVELETSTRGGATRVEWQARFAALRGELETARQELSAAQRELEEVAGEAGQWQVSAPGALGGASAGDSSPVSYRLRQEIRRKRDEVARGERRLEELRIEANLAGVPEEWQLPEASETQP